MTTKPFKPLLAASLDGVDPKTLAFPLMWSPKLDGIRVLIHPDHGAVTRKIKRIPNDKIFAQLSDPLLNGFDGEIVFGPVTDKDVFNRTQASVMKIEGPGMDEPFRVGGQKEASEAGSGMGGTYLVFDDFTYPDEPFTDRYARLADRVAGLPSHLTACVKIVPHFEVETDVDLGNIERVIVEQGYEGVMLRNPHGRYKFGRSTVNEMILAKVKRFADTDGTVIGFEEMMHNDNEKVRDALGNAKRATLQENMRPAGTLGALIVELPEFGGVTVKVGSGYTDELKQSIWNNQAAWLGSGIVLKYQPSGMKDLPRFAVFKGRRKD